MTRVVPRAVAVDVDTVLASVQERDKWQRRLEVLQAALADVRADVADIAEAATLDLGPLARPTLTLRSDGERGWHTSSVSMPR